MAGGSGQRRVCIGQKIVKSVSFNEIKYGWWQRPKKSLYWAENRKELVIQRKKYGWWQRPKKSLYWAENRIERVIQ